MTPEELRASIPALERTVYLNTGASGPSPRRVVEAAADFLAYHAYEAPARQPDPELMGMGMYDAASEAFEEGREAVAGLLNASPGEVALTQSTTDAINRVLTAIDWTPGEAIVRTDLEHSAGILPPRRLADLRDLSVRVVPSEGGRLDLEAYREAVAGARLVVLSSISWTHGTRLPVREAVEIAHDAGAAVLVDAVQSVGQTPVDVREWGAEFVAGAGHKWLLGPWGAGFLYVREGVERDLAPRRLGYRGVQDAKVEGYAFEPGARRLELGTVSPAPYAGLREAIDVVGEVGPGAVEDRIARLAGRLAAGLGEKRLVGPREPESGLVSFTVEDPEAFLDRATEHDVAIRGVPVEGAVRASVHAFNTAGDVDALLELV